MQNTPQYAGFWIRCVATLIDLIAITLVIGIPLTYLYGTEYWLSESLTPKGIWDVLLSYVFPVLATVWFWLKFRATPGKLLTGLQIVDEGSLATISLGQAVVRCLAYLVALLPFGLGVIWVAFDQRKQGWHDKLAKTVVIKE